jgi:tRNA uridine 5-carboxymethylaminomethyl modification enzyme
LVGDIDWERFNQRRDRIAKVKAALRATRLRKTDAVFSAAAVTVLSDLGESINLAELAQRRGIPMEIIQRLLPTDVQTSTTLTDLEFALADNLYAGYIRTQDAAVQRLRHNDKTLIPPDLDFRALDGLSHEMAERLERARPRTIGEARDIPGLTPAALSTLFVNISL